MSIIYEKKVLTERRKTKGLGKGGGEIMYNFDYVHQLLLLHYNILHVPLLNFTYILGWACFYAKKENGILHQCA